MHDYHAVKALVERLTGGSDDPGWQGVAAVRVRAGAAFSPEALEQAYEMLTVDTPLEGSRLVVEELPEERTCPACGRSWAVSREDLAGHLLVCPACGALSELGDGALLEVLEITTRPGA